MPRGVLFQIGERPESQFIGLVTISGRADKASSSPFKMGGRIYPWVVSFSQDFVVRDMAGPPVASVVADLSFVENRRQWGHHFQGSPIEIEESDFHIIEEVLIAWPSRASK